MTAPHSHLLEGSPRLHYLEWNPDASRTIVLLHGNSANAWWWEPLARVIAPDYRLLALDQRGHGDSEWARPVAYSPADYASDIARFVQHIAPNAEKPVVVGHSMGGLNVLAFARRHPESVRGAMAIDVAVTSSRGRDRYLRRLKGLPVVTYPDLATAKARYRLMPKEGGIPDEVVLEIAERSLARTDEGRWTLKFDRESFLGGDGLEVLETIKEIRIPTMLVRAGHSRIMSAEAAEHARASNPLTQLVTIADAHHHVILEKPAEVARVIEEFAARLYR
ncbi:alpha/beta fold hydrolase [Candidatus Binatus sp.]|uniref:alpha/beta fold hydrolase n=2 Tax=Candidatus Binatus sp. TaxID=2811406 RepID=UPI003BAF31BB